MQKKIVNNANNLRRLVITPATTYSDVFYCWVEQYKPLRNAAKILGRMADVSPRTAATWLNRSHAPHGNTLIRLMAANDDLCDAIDELVKAMRSGP